MKKMLKTDQYQFEEGYCQAARRSATQDAFTVLYYDRDHLGNIRQVTKDDGTQSGKVVQRMDYYPFGALFCDGTSDGNYQPRRYSGKEYDRMHGLNTYDYGARQYDPALARWDRVDPLCEKYYSISPYVYCAGNPVRYIDLKGDSITMDMQSLKAIYNGLEDGNNISMTFNKNGVLNPLSISEAAKNSNDTFVQDLYEIAINPQMVELKVTNKNQYVKNGSLKSEDWNTPKDFNVEKDFSGASLEQLLRLGYPKGNTIRGNLGQTLYPSEYSNNKASTNENIQIIINAKGTLNHQSVGIAHEFGHVILFLRGLPHSHTDNGDFIYDRQQTVMKRLGYDYPDR